MLSSQEFTLLWHGTFIPPSISLHLLRPVKRRKRHFSPHAEEKELHSFTRNLPCLHHRWESHSQCPLHTRKFDRGLTSLLHDELHWLDVPERVTYKMGVMVYRCLHAQAPRYLADHLITPSDVASRLRLRSANRHQLISYLAVDSTHTAVGRFRSLVRRYGTRCLTISEIRRVVLTVLSSLLR